MDKLITSLRQAVSLLITLWALGFIALGGYGIVGGLLSLFGAAILHPSTASFLAKHTSRWVEPGQAFKAAIGLWFVGTFFALSLQLIFSSRSARPYHSPIPVGVSATDENEETSEPIRSSDSRIRKAEAQKKKAAADKTQVTVKKKQAEKKTVGPQPKPSVSNDPAFPSKLVTILSETTQFSGMQCGLEIEGDGWHKSEADGLWNAVLRRSFGDNEVSCLLESEDVSTLQRAELEAEFYQPDSYENEMLLQFLQSAQVLMHPVTPPKEFAEAVINKSAWSNGQWELTSDAYANGGFGLKLRKR